MATAPSQPAPPTPPAAEEFAWLLPLVLLPVAVNRLAPYPYVADRRLLLHAFGAAALAALAARAAGLFRSPRRLPRPLAAVLAAGAATLGVRLAAAASGLCPADSLLGLPARDGGLLSQLSCAALFLAALAGARGRAQAGRIAVAAFLGSVAPVAVGTLQAFGAGPFVPTAGFPEGRLWGTFGNAVAFGSYLAAVLPATLWTAWRAAGLPGRRRALAAVPAAFAALDLWLLARTGSRGPLLAAAGAGGLGLVGVLRRAGARNAAKALAASLAVGILLFVGGIQLVAKSDSVQSMRREGMVPRRNTVEVRLALYEAVTRQLLGRGARDAPAVPGAFADPRAAWRPWIGYGPDCLAHPLLRGAGPSLERAEGESRVPDSTHSATLDALGGSGLAGLAALAALVWTLLAAMASAERLGHGEPGAPRRVGDAPRRQSRIAAALPPAGAVAGAAAMTALWGARAWAPGALAGGYVGVLGAIAALMRRNAPGDPPARRPAAAALLPITGFCMAATVWIDAQFAPWSSTPALLLHLGLAAGLAAPGTDAPEKSAADSPFGGWCALALAASLAWLALSAGCRFPAERLGALHEVALFGEWLRTALAACERLHLAVAGGIALACALAATRTRAPARAAAVTAAMALAAFLAARAEWPALSGAMRIAGAGYVADGGLPAVALRLAPPDDAPLAAHRAWLHGQLWRSWLARVAKDSPAAKAARAWARAARMADDCAAARPFDAHVVRAAGDVCLDAAKYDPANAARWAALALPRLRAALELAPRAPAFRTCLAQAVLACGRSGAPVPRAALDEAVAALRAAPPEPPDTSPAPSLAAPLQQPRLPASPRRLLRTVRGALVAALASFLLVPPVRRLALRTGFLDAPAARKVHRAPTPLLGGLAILAGAWAAALSARDILLAPPFGTVLGVATALAAVGLADDRRPLPWQLKLAAQFLAAATLFALGVRVRLAWLPAGVNAALTVLWLVGVTNAVNFLDNMNGLSNGIAAWSALAVGAIALAAGEWDVAAAALALAGACAGFLRGNNPWRASLFMGDAGSLFLGLVLAALALLLRFPNNANWVTWLCPVILLAVPVFDMTHVCLARLRRGRNPFSTPGKDHTSHLFERMGLSRPRAVLAVHALVVACAAATWAVSFSGPVAAYAVAGCVLAAAVFLLAYFELRFGAGGSDEYRDPR